MQKKSEPVIDSLKVQPELSDQFEDDTSSIKHEQEDQIKKSVPKSNTQRELKSLLMLSAQGNKSQKSKLKDCLSLFELLYEKQETIAREVLSKNNNFDFVTCEFDIPTEQINLFAFGNRKSVIKLVELEKVELKRLNSDKW